MKERAVEILKNSLEKLNLKLDEMTIMSLIEKPKDYTNGDYSFPCFSLSKELKKSPQQIAVELRAEIGTPPDEFENIESVGPYINFYENKKTMAKTILEEVKNKGDEYGKLESNNQKLIIEFPSPNTNKPLHLGHLRNMSIGDSVSRICQANGYEVIRANLNNDRGVHICKSMLAYQKWGKKITPEKAKKKSDHFVGDYYVKFATKAKEDKTLEDEAQAMLKKWEEKDPEVVELWKQMNIWALEGFKETYEKFGIKIDKEYYESQIYEKGKELIMKGLADGIFKQKEDNAIAIDLSSEGLGEKVLLRSDGTSIYITQDIYLAKLKLDEFDVSESIYVTGNEQDYHFKVLFSILEKLGFASREKLKHLSYGMVNLPNGRMKSREGTVVDADDLIDELQKIVIKDMQKRYKLSKIELEERSLKITLAALKYFLLKVDIKKDMIFNPEESISFEGDTGPYCQYSYARASSILRKSQVELGEFNLPEELEEKESILIMKLNEYKDLVTQSYAQMNPTIIATYAYKLSQIFNEFYHSCQAIGSENELFRLHLINAFRQILKNALLLLGIETLEEM